MEYVSPLLFFPGKTRDRHVRCGSTFHCTANPDVAETPTLALEAGRSLKSPTAEPLIECPDRVVRFVPRKLF